MFIVSAISQHLHVRSTSDKMHILVILCNVFYTCIYEAAQEKSANNYIHIKYKFNLYPPGRNVSFILSEIHFVL